MDEVERFVLLSLLQRALSARDQAERERVACVHRCDRLANAAQRALMLAYLARVDRVSVDPALLIKCLTERDTPHELPATQ